MTEKSNSRAPLLCPSTRPEMEGSAVFGVVGGTGTQPRVAYLLDLQPVTAEILALAQPAEPTEVFRFASPCAGGACKHFDGSNCRLATRIVQMLPRVVERLPPCHIRPNCRWWQQEGKAACARCPQIVSEVYGPSELLHQVADPEGSVFFVKGGD
jgi:hypothetical protein